MRAVIQITERARLTCEGEEISDCGRGMCILLGLRHDDTQKEADKVIDKILKMRIFPDENGKLNLSASQIGADLLVVSNFTLYGRLSSRRPDFLESMKFGPAKELYEYFLEKMQSEADLLQGEDGKKVTVFPGVFGGDMKVDLINDGPITILVDTDTL